MASRLFLRKKAKNMTTRNQNIGVGLVFAAIIALGCGLPYISQPAPAPSAPPVQKTQLAPSPLEIASPPCERSVKNAAQYDLRWTTWGLVFSHSRRNGIDPTIKLIGDMAEAQNGFGNWVRVNYTCTFDLNTKTVINVTMERGRLPQ
jgi:hypothetical protein